MPIYYVSPYGSDTKNNGRGPDPNDPTNKPFATLAKALAAGAPTAAGDTVYLAPGVYRANTTVGVSGASGNPIAVIGDPGNAEGFKDSSGNLVSAGEIRCTSFTVNDTTTPTNAVLLYLNGPSYLSFDHIWFIGCQSTAGFLGSIAITGAHDIAFRSCMFSEGSAAANNYSVVTLANTATQGVMNVSFDQCFFHAIQCNVVNVNLTSTATGSGDYDSGIRFRNCQWLGGNGHLTITGGGGGSNLGGGVEVWNSVSAYGRGNSFVTTSASNSSTYPLRVYNSIVLKSTGGAFSASVTGQIVEDYNQVSGSYTLTTAGANTKSLSQYCMMLDCGQGSLWGQKPRPFLTPTVGSPQLGFGNQTGSPTVDFLGRRRPEGGGSLLSGVGYLERHDTAVQERLIVDSGSSIRLDGPGSHEFQIPVDAASTMISVKCRYDSNHGTTTPPQAVLVACPEIGVSAQTVTASAATDTWLTLSFAAITPTAKGVVKVQLVARPAAANGKAYFDSFAVS